MNYPPPPPEIQTIVELIGEEAALALMERHGGAEIYIPLHADGSRLVADIGYAATSALAAYFGRERLKVPLCKPWRARILWRQGLSRNAIARKLLMSTSSVDRALEDWAPKTRPVHIVPGQMDLF